MYSTSNNHWVLIKGGTGNEEMGNEEMRNGMEMVVRPCRDVTMFELMMQAQDALFLAEISTGNHTGLLLIANLTRREINLI